MANIMASAFGPACALAGMLLVNGQCRAADTALSGSGSPVPAPYSLSYDQDTRNNAFSVFHMAVADEFGAVGSSFATSDNPKLRPLTRLDSTWNVPMPAGMLPLRIGDGVSSADVGDQPARMGGIQIGNSVAALPAVIAPPSVVAAPDDAASPLSQSNRFISHLRTLVQIQSQSLVTAGQSNYSLESGRLRENFEVRSNDYGPWITSGTYRYGLNAATTVDAQMAQVAGQQSFVGIGVLEGLGPLGLISAGVASSRDPDSSGWVARMGYDYTHARLNITLRSHVQSLGFQDVGDTAMTENFRQSTLASAGFDFGSLGKVSLAGATQTYADDSRRDIIALTHAMPLGGGGLMSTAAAYSPGQFGSAALLLSFTYPFDYGIAPACTARAAAGSAMDRTLIDAFGQTRLPQAARTATDRMAQD